MNSEKKLRQFLQNRFDNEKFSLNEEAWNETRAYINARRRGQGRRGVAALLILAGTVLSVCWLLMESETMIKSVNNPNQVAVVNREIISGIQNSPRTAVAEHVQKPFRNTSPGKTGPGLESVVRHAGVTTKKLPGRTANKIPGDTSDEKTVPPVIESVPLLPAAYPVMESPAVAQTDPEIAEDNAAHPAVGGIEQMVPIRKGLPSISPAETEPALVMVEVVDPTATIIPATAAIIPDSFRRRLPPAGVYYEIGSSFLNGWRVAGVRDGRGIVPLAGIGFLNRLDNWRSVSFGAQYLMVSNLSTGRRTSRVTSYRFGEESDVTVITPTRLHYLVVPVRFHRYTRRGNEYGAGVNVSYLLNVDASIDRYQERPGYVSEAERSQLSGYTEGFAWYDTQLTAFYRHNLGRSFALNAGVFFGLVDIKENTFFRQELKERNSGLTLSLIYYGGK